MLQRLEIDAGGDAGGRDEGFSLTLPEYDARGFVGQSAWGLARLYQRGRGLWLNDIWEIRGNRLVRGTG